MTTELALSNNQSIMPGAQEWQTMTSMAEVLLKSGFLPSSIKTAPAALAIMLKGRELQIPPMQALASIHIVEGKPTLSAELMAALVHRAGHELHVAETSATKCVVEVRRKNSQRWYKQTFTIEEAQKAGVTGKQNWQKYPAAMLRARAISAACRVEFPDVIAGLYTPEELGADTEITQDGQEIIVSVPETTTVNNNQVDTTTGEILPKPMNHSEFAAWLSRMNVQPGDVAKLYGKPSIKAYVEELKAAGNSDPLRTILKDYVTEVKPGGFEWFGTEPVEADDVPFGVEAGK